MGHFQYHHRITIQFEVYHFIIDKHSINSINIDFRVNKPTKRAKESNVIEVFDTNNKCICYLIVFIRVLFCSLFSFSASNWRHHFAERSILFVQWTECVFVCVQENRFSDNTETSIFFFILSACFELSEFFSPFDIIRFSAEKKQYTFFLSFPFRSFRFRSVQFRKNYILFPLLSLPPFVYRFFLRPFRPAILSQSFWEPWTSGE